MKRVLLISLALLLTFHSALYAKNTLGIKTEKEKAEIQSTISENLEILSTGFEINKGQFPDELKYRYGNASANVDFYEDKVVFSLREMTKGPDLTKMDGHPEFDYATWQIEFQSVAAMSMEHAEEVEMKKVNSFDVNGKRIPKVLTESVTYKNVYNNIDLVFYKNASGSLKYDYILHPGADLNDIKLKYVGVEDIEILPDGTLVYNSKWGEVREDKPISYKQENGNTVQIEYVLDQNVLGFTGPSQITETVVLDPIYVDWSTYFYGVGSATTTWSWTWVLDLDIDDSNNVYVTGMTNDRFPTGIDAYDTTVNGFYDAYVCKLAPDGDSIIWFSYVGGSSYEYSFSLTVNSSQQPVISGFSWSSNFPTTPGAYDRSGGAQNYYKGFVVKFGDRGDSLVYSTFLGGSNSDLIQSMALDGNGNVYLTGRTNSSDFPTTPNCYQSTYGGGSGWWWNGGDAFLTKMNSTGTALIFSTYIGGAENEEALEIALSPSNEIYLVGKTASGNFPVTPGSSIFNYNVRGATDGFVMKFRTDGKTLVYSKLMGGDGEDWFEGIYINDIDEAYIAGISKSSNFYTTTGAYQANSGGGADIVLVKMNSLGQNVSYSTYIGGSSDEMYYQGWIYNANVSVSANVREEAIVCGISRSSNFPVTGDALMSSNPSNSGGGWWNTSAVIVKLDYLGTNLLYGTYYGGSSFEIPGANKLRRISCYTNILYGGITASIDYPTTKGVYKETKSSSGSGFFWTGFISKFRDTLYTDLIELALTDTIVECDNVFEILDIKNQGADILWSNGATSRFQIIQDTGTYWVQATYGCDTVRDTIAFVLEYSPVIPALPNDTIYCDNFPIVNLDAGNDSMLAVYTWNTGDTVQAITVNQEDTYWVNIATPNCGDATDTIHMVLQQTPDISLAPDSLFCDSVNVILSGGLVDNAEIYRWNTGDSVNFIHVLDTGLYQLHVENFCGEDSAQSKITMLMTPVALLPNDTTFCDQVQFKFNANGRPQNSESYLWLDLDKSIALGTADSIEVFSPGLYGLQVSNACASLIDSIDVALLYTPNVDMGSDITYCDTIDLTLDPGKTANDEIYLWDDNSTDSNRTIRTGGKYWLQISNLCGTSSDTLELIQRFTPVADIMNDQIGAVMDSIFCNTVSIDLDADINQPDINYLWNTGETSSKITADKTGDFWVVLTGFCGTAADTVNFEIITTPVVSLGEDRKFCGTVEPFILDVEKTDNQEKYLWSDNSTAPQLQVTSIGNTWVQVSNKCGTDSDTMHVRISPYPVVDLGKDTTLCGNFTLTLDAGNPDMDYLWEPYGETTQSIEATEQRIYTVTVTNGDDCSTTEEFEITGDCISHHHIPSAFTPNGDGRNDQFKPTLINYEEYHMQIYNRWGELVFESFDMNDGWNGKYKGDHAQQGTYMYVINFVTTEDLKGRQFKGVLHLLR